MNLLGGGSLLAYRARSGGRLPRRTDVYAGASRPPVCPAVGSQPGGDPSRLRLGRTLAVRPAPSPPLCPSASPRARAGVVPAPSPPSCGRTGVPWESGPSGRASGRRVNDPPRRVKMDRRSRLSDPGASAFCYFGCFWSVLTVLERRRYFCPLGVGVLIRDTLPGAVAGLSVCV